MLDEHNDELNREAIEEYKAQKVQIALQGLPVVYQTHHLGLTPNMAQVNGHSIIWHEYSYGADDRETVELWLKGTEQPERVKLAELRKLIDES